MAVFSMTKSKEKDANLILSYITGLVVSLIASFGLVILLAFMIKWFSFEDKFIVPASLAIKCISVLFGSMIAIKGSSNGLIKGAVFGLLYMSSSFVTFSLLSGSFSFDLSTLLDVACSILMGGLVGIIKVNRRN